MRCALVCLLAMILGCTTKTTPPPAVTTIKTAKPDAQRADAKQKEQARAASAPADPSAAEKAKFVGTWVAVEGEFQGIRMGAQALPDMKWKFTPDKVTYSELGRVVEANFTVQPNSNPKTFDFTGSGAAIQGIYELKGDMLKACFAADSRPTSFATGGTSQTTMMFVFKKAGK